MGKNVVNILIHIKMRSTVLNNVKNCFKKSLLKLDMLLLPLLLPFLLKVKGVKAVHFSIDDVSYHLAHDGQLLIRRDIDALIRRLGGVTVTLFLFEKNESCDIPVPMQAKVGIHLPSMKYGECESCLNSTYFRFHYYKASTEEVKRMGVSTALCSHDGRRSYDLTPSDQKVVDSHRPFYKGETEYIATDVRLEWPIIPQLLRMKEGSTGMCVVFGHEWGIDSYRERLEMFVSYCNKRKIRFIG